MVDNKTSFLLKDINTEMWKKVKIEAIKQDMTLRDFILLCLHLNIEKTENGGS